MITNTDLSGYGSIIEDVEQLLDALPVDTALLRKGHEIVACNQPASEKGLAPGVKCYKAWLNIDKPCAWCHAQEALGANKVVDHIVHAGFDDSGQVTELETGGIVSDSHWIPIAPDLYIHFSGVSLVDQESRNKAIEDIRAFLEKLPPDIAKDANATIKTIDEAFQEQMENLSKM